ncbi:hypothetical protein HDU76_001139 [Blyttiomyces sp. JEL0837]|nr:hypothetical protein HDU76_001139 [Blyttiomyces sp. JEL0837]
MTPNDIINSTLGDTPPYPHEWAELIPSDHYFKTTHGIYLLLGGFICAFSLVSHFVKGLLYMSEAMVAVIVGVIIGPLAGKVLDPAHFGSSLGDVTLEFSRIIIAIQCMVCGVDLPGNYLFREWKSVGMLIGPVMLVGWVVSALGVYWILGIDFYNALIIAACLAPTDPVLANNIVKGKFAEAHIPLHVRLIISAESGANDGLGTPLLFLAIYLQRILLIMGVVSLMGADDILAVFVAGNVLTWDQWFNERIQHSNFQEVIDALLNLAYFVYVGAVIPFTAFGSTAELSIWKLVILAIWIMLLRRPPWVMLFYKWIPALKTPLDAWFAAWYVMTFGPIGADAIFYSHIAIKYLGVPATPLLPIIYFLVLSSIIVHGGSVPFFKMSLSRTSTYTDWEIRRRQAREEAEGVLPTFTTWNGIQAYAVGLFGRRRGDGGDKVIDPDQLRAGGISGPTGGKVIGDYVGKDDFVCDVKDNDNGSEKGGDGGGGGGDGDWKLADANTSLDTVVGGTSLQALQGRVNVGPDEIAMVNVGFALPPNGNRDSDHVSMDSN